MTKQALIVFDIDGTLFQTELVTTPAVQRTFAAYGLPVPDTESIHATFGRPVEGYLAWLASLCPPDQAQEIVDAVNRLELELVGTEGQLYPGIREVLAQLKHEGHVLAICSNGPTDYVDTFLDAHDVRCFFDIIRTRGTVYGGKEDMFREILRLIPVRPAIVIGDRNDDIAAAHANGALAIAARYGFGSEEEVEEADAHVHKPSDIPASVAALIRNVTCGIFSDSPPSQQ